MAVQGLELFEGPQKQLYIVTPSANRDGSYAVYRVHKRFVQRFLKKYRAVDAIRKNMLDEETTDAE